MDPGFIATLRRKAVRSLQPPHRPSRTQCRFKLLLVYCSNLLTSKDSYIQKSCLGKHSEAIPGLPFSASNITKFQGDCKTWAFTDIGISDKSVTIQSYHHFTHIMRIGLHSFSKYPFVPAKLQPISVHLPALLSSIRVHSFVSLQTPHLFYPFSYTRWRSHRFSQQPLLAWYRPCHKLPRMISRKEGVRKSLLSSPEPVLSLATWVRVWVQLYAPAWKRRTPVVLRVRV